MTRIQGWAAPGPKQKLKLMSLDSGELGAEEVEIIVEHCGICHSDLSMINNDWGISIYPIIPGHEAVGRISAIGTAVKGLIIGQRVGVGWNSGSCMHCQQCVTGQHNLCSQVLPTIAGGHRGGFADRMRAHWVWVIPLPEQLDISSVGPLLCGGVTVFAPLMNLNIKPTDHIGIVGIGGLGHLGLKFANAWGCEVTAFTTSASKIDEAKGFGAHHVISSYDSASILKAANSLDLLLVTINKPLDWATLLKTLKPNGRMHVVGAVLEPMPIPAIELIFGQKSVSGSPTGSPSALATMLEFAARHHITPQVEHFPMNQVNDALAHLAAGKARYRIVLDADF
ncbi:MAG: NAD(P)-dependent alcohol dehydrogenase [Methylobacter sp.]|nr:MAG: NAD(P)-dependent alcohol dehydrogenase [Methylobacter sp.]